MTESAEEKRRRLIQLVDRILRADLPEDDDDRLIKDYQRNVTFPGVTDLIFYWDEYVEHEPSAAGIVDRALAHRPIAL